MLIRKINDAAKKTSGIGRWLRLIRSKCGRGEAYTRNRPAVPAWAAEMRVKKID